MAQTSEEFEFLKGVYQRLDWTKRIEPNGELYEPLYAAPGREDPVERIRKAIGVNDVESRNFFSGFRGSGKTTELFRLQELLEKEDGCLVLYANALEYIDPNQPIDISDLLIALAGAFSDRVEARYPGIRPLEESYWRRLFTYLTTTEIEWEGFSVGVKDVGSLKANLLGTPTFRQKVQKELAPRIGELDRQAKKFFGDCVRSLREKLPGVKIVFLFDGLEQIRGSRLTDEEVLKSVVTIFAQHRERLNLPSIHVVYAVPPWLKFTLPGTPTFMQPTVRQWENDEARTPYAAGSHRMYRVLERRFGGSDGLLRFFGSADAAGLLIGVCGGHFRDLFELARTAILKTDTLPVTAATLESSILDLRQTYLPIAEDDAVWLQGIAESRADRLKTAGPEHVNRFTHFLDWHLVLFLRNGEDWYDVHPLIREDVAKVARRAAREAAPVSNG